jgi:2-C-methyl-D-erythritol 4-phosphate cytidylyltransferase/2-C-methyl-D-erythritol 2,4-cyclodiphosphate synthase
LSDASPADAIIVAAGTSSRMAGQDKLLAEVAGRPLLAWTLAAFEAAPEVGRIVLVTSAGRVDSFASAAWLPTKLVGVVAGGERRQASVAAGVQALADVPDDRVILVHDGARPMVSGRTIADVVAATRAYGAAIPVIPVAETLKRLDGEVVHETVDRTGLAAAQTPQGVTAGALRTAYARFPPDAPETWTDEASLLEACTIPVHAVLGDPDNLKVTLPADLARASAMLAGRGSVRHGIGHDSHPFGPDLGLALGGIVIDDAPRLYGHSDGDVALHAIADAVLGAAGLGDLGRLFPAGPDTPKGIASAELLGEVRRRVEAAGWRVTGIDVTIVAARPKLASYLDGMRDATAALLGLSDGAVNVKASTGNLDGSEGAGRSISALATASIERRP